MSNNKSVRDMSPEEYENWLKELKAKDKKDSEEYEIKLANLLKEIPEEFHPFVSSYSWEKGHSYGYNEVYSYASDIVEQLKPCIEKYREMMEESFDKLIELG